MRELNRTLRRAKDRDLVKAVGRGNKQVGRQFIDRWIDPSPTPSAVGRGRGATVRPSAAKSQLKLRVGGGHRAGTVPRSTWGVRSDAPRDSRGRYLPRPARPHIVESAYRRRDDIAAAWLQEIRNELGRSGLEVGNR